MTLVGELFVADVLGKPVLDPLGDEIGRLRDIAVVGGGTFPRAAGLLLERKKKVLFLPWEDLSIFNRRIISSRKRESDLSEYAPAHDQLLIGKDLLDKQIVDIDGAKVVRVNDVKLAEEGGAACVTGVDVGVRGILRRLGVERRGEAFFRAIRHPLRHQMISWALIQPLHEKLDRLTLAVPREALSGIHPADIAQIISGLSPEERKGFFGKLDLETAAEALHELEPEVQADLITDMDKEQAADVIERMPPDEAADVIADLSLEKAQEILGLIEKEEAQDIHELLGHEEDTAGGLMTNEYLAYAPGITVGQTLEKFRGEASEIESVYYVYVVEDDKLLGVVGLRDLILEAPSKTLGEVMHTKLITARADANQEKVAELISKYNLLALPVVDEENCLLGIVTVDDVVDLLLPPASRRRRRRM
ncbi:MAG TPA: CBS domain-containing protein [Candidatus Deferrimicrobiaceae bacterium]|nr:CBS domain-containing protein [Candidatus Deferrimicrobiaceae bacterium]